MTAHPRQSSSRGGSRYPGHRCPLPCARLPHLWEIERARRVLKPTGAPGSPACAVVETTSSLSPNGVVGDHALYMAIYGEAGVLSRANGPRTGLTVHRIWVGPGGESRRCRKIRPTRHSRRRPAEHGVFLLSSSTRLQQMSRSADVSSGRGVRDAITCISRWDRASNTCTCR